MKKINLVKVGTDGRPATERRLDEVQADWESFKKNPQTVQMWPHDTSIEQYVLDDAHVLMLFLGTDDHPVNADDFCISSSDKDCTYICPHCVRAQIIELY
jgi:hypothetical protein